MSSIPFEINYFRYATNYVHYKYVLGLISLSVKIYCIFRSMYPIITTQNTEEYSVSLITNC